MAAKNDESRHYKKVWDDVISDLLEIVLNECDVTFKQQCSLHIKPLDLWKKELESEYRILRKNFKELCYGNQNDEGLLDSKKLAALFCQALIRKKAFVFDETMSSQMLVTRKQELGLKPIEFNHWIVNNILVNYKLAYLVSLQLIYLTLLEDLLSKEETIGMANELNRLGHLQKYPVENMVDSFEVNIIIALARSDMKGLDLDLLLFSMQLYQIEMYTRKFLEDGINVDERN